MKIAHFENKTGFEICLSPESMKEVTELLRIAKNAKKKPASIYISFSSDEPVLNVWIEKINEKRQYNSIRPYPS